MNAIRPKRIGLGILVTIAVLGVFDLIPSFVPSSAIDYRLFGYFYFWVAIEGAIIMFMAALIGAYVAKVNFVGPAVLLSITVWTFTVYFLNSIASAAGPDDILNVASINILGLLFGAYGSGIGALVGRRFAKAKTEENAVGAI